MWFEDDIVVADDHDGSDSGMSENLHDSISNNSDGDDIESIDMEVINHVYNNNNNNQQLNNNQIHHIIHPMEVIIEEDDEEGTASIDSGADFSQNRNIEELDDDVFKDYSDYEEENVVDHIIADPTIKVSGIATNWVAFDNNQVSFYIVHC